MAEIQRSETISGVVIVEPQIFQDPRGFFAETWRQEWLPESRPMIQSNRADRSKGTLVGLHYHLNQADYWYVSHGVAQVVLHDLRQGSPIQGSTLSFNLGSLDQSKQKGVYIPPGVAHGFAVAGGARDCGGIDGAGIGGGAGVGCCGTGFVLEAGTGAAPSCRIHSGGCGS